MSSFVLNIFKKKGSRQMVDKNDSLHRSRQFFILEGVTGIGQFSLTSGAFLAGFIHMLKGSDQINGMIAVIPAMAGVFQIFSSLIFEKMTKRKHTMVKMAIGLRSILALVYFIPMLMMPLGLGLEAFVLCFIIAYTINALNTPALVNWLVELTPLSIRGQYLAYREKISLLVTAMLTIGLGKVLDYTRDAGNDMIGFGIVGLIVIVFSILNIYALIHIQEPSEHVPNHYKLKEVVTTPIKSPSFKRIILLFIIWNFALQIGGPFITVYMVTHLKLQYTYMMSLSVITTLVRVAISGYWGRMADKKSWFLSTKWSVGILAVVHFLWGFVTDGNYHVLVPILHVCSGIAWGGIGISLFNMQFLFAKKEGRTMYIGLNAAIGGIASGVAVWIGGQMIKLLENQSFMLFNIPIGNLQMTFFISGLLLFICPIFVKLFIEHQQVEQEDG
ncbi:MFS transporter [Vallitalea pronyensis]|uniref:MFS transporter n=1 Tax=Vallitalea pronyensis TaxID=1348613 RepID=A0A8J8MJ25_9FIRM|nr:MFS transporter [Vallitalea pronyensis]QUI22590.1 MFS transporter [Vallitalea pronyensis]